MPIYQQLSLSVSWLTILKLSHDGILRNVRGHGEAATRT